eukprot:scaffold27866_cov78-Cyclotella_meneghiniana.AAC.2
MVPTSRRPTTAHTTQHTHQTHLPPESTEPSHSSNRSGDRKINFEWGRWLSVGSQAGPSTPCIPLIVGSRCGLAPFHVHRL